MPRKPKTRSERVDWLILKFGPGAVSAYSTDRIVKRMFDRLYEPSRPDYVEKEGTLPVCLRCGWEVQIIWECCCTDTGPLVDPEEYERWKAENPEIALKEEGDSP